jgi:long-subunit acyl-CoA synthetase (AMP-forming)
MQGKYNPDKVAEDPTADDIALVMYTSGATGTPKVRQRHVTAAGTQGR